MSCLYCVHLEYIYCAITMSCMLASVEYTCTCILVSNMCRTRVLYCNGRGAPALCMHMYYYWECFMIGSMMVMAVIPSEQVWEQQRNVYHHKNNSHCHEKPK